MMRQNPMPQQIYRHFKGNLYQIVTLAEHTETGECLVVYQALYGDYRIYARPLSMFMEKVDREKYPESRQEYRFEIVDMPAVSTEGGARRTAQAEKTETERKDAESAKPAAEQKQDRQEEAVRQREEVQESTAEQMEHLAEEGGLDPLVIEFLDAGSYEERLNILAALHHRITDDMINTMAIAIDVEVREGDLEERYSELRNCLLLYDKFECNRLR